MSRRRLCHIFWMAVLRTANRSFSRKLMEHYSHIRVDAKRDAVNGIAAKSSQAVFEPHGAQNFVY